MRENRVMRGIFLALMLICLVYAVSIYMVGSGTFSFVIWFVLAALSGVAFYLSGNGRWLKIPVMVRSICCGLIAAALITVIICIICMISHFNDKGAENLDYIIVLGAQMRVGGPSPIYKYRLDAAYDYLKENPDTIGIISGGQGANEPVSEGEGGKEYLISRGIEPSRLIAETKAMDTSENIRFSLELMEKEASPGADKLRIGVVTNGYHLFRGIHLAKGLTDNEICGISAYSLPWYLPNNMARECFGIIRDCRKFK